MPTRMPQPARHTTQAEHSMLCATTCPGPPADTCTQIMLVPAHGISTLTSNVKEWYQMPYLLEQYPWIPVGKPVECDLLWLETL